MGLCELGSAGLLEQHTVPAEPLQASTVAGEDMQPKIELHKRPDVAHWPMIDVPDRVAKLILDRY